MIWHLIKKEIRTKIVDFRFMITSIIGFCLIIMTTFILSEQYSKHVDQYNEFITSDREGLNDVKVFSDLRLNAHKPPNPLWIFNKGVSNRVDQSMRIRHNWVPRQGFQTVSENPFLNIFQFFDLTTIFQIVLSLLAILMVYDGICGEREEGTLTAMLSNHVARYQILFSKWLSGLISVIIPLLLSLIVSLLIMILVYGITFNGQEWIRIGIMIFTALIFLSVFISAGLLISSLVKRAAVSLIWLLFIWVFIVFIQPNLGSYLASSVVSLPPREKIESSQTEMWSELYRKGAELDSLIRAEVPGDPWHSDHSDDWPFYQCFDGNYPGLYRYVLRTQRIQPLFLDGADREWQIYKSDYHSCLEKQLAWQNLFDKGSPTALFNRITALLSYTSIDDHEAFLDQARMYRKSFLDYMISERKIFSDNANLYFTRQTMDQIINNDYEKRSRLSREGVKGIVFYGRDYYDPLDLTGLPQFTFQPASLGRSFQHILPDMGILILLSSLFFYF
jgi:ABC-type transport system involved in multi-copper enzyme maturation permease subunit